MSVLHETIGDSTGDYSTCSEIDKYVLMVTKLAGGY